MIWPLKVARFNMIATSAHPKARAEAVCDGPSECERDDCSTDGVMGAYLSKAEDRVVELENKVKMMQESLTKAVASAEDMGKRLAEAEAAQRDLERVVRTLGGSNTTWLCR